MRAGIFLSLMIFAFILSGMRVGSAEFEPRIEFVDSDGKPVDVEATVVAPFGEQIRTVASGGSVLLSRVVRGTYLVSAYWKGVHVGTAVFSVNDGNLAGELMVAVRDLTVRISDATGKTVIENVYADIEGPTRETSLPRVLASYGVLFVPALPEAVYTIVLRWVSPYGEQEQVIGEFRNTLDGFNKAVQLRNQIFDVKVKVLDLDGRVVAGAKVILGRITATTDILGEASFRTVPKGLYDLTVLLEESVLSSESIEVSQSHRDFLVKVGLHKLRVKTSGLLHQSLPHSTIILRKNGAPVAAFTANEEGFLEIPRLTEASYRVEAIYKGYVVAKDISIDQLAAGEIATFQFPIFLELAGIPLSLESSILLLIAQLGLVLSIVFLLHEYTLWRKRRIWIKAAS